ncbi:MAG: transporter [Acidobacteriota bacterium]|nr:transporter [Acidobacteriota bacterium]
MNMKRLLQLKLSLVLLALLAVLGWSRAAGAQPAIASDRPGLGTGAVVLDAGTTQIEAGAELAINDERRFSAGQIVVRWGLPFAELQALVNSFVVSRSPDQAMEGFEDLGLGVKIPLVAREDDSLQISMLASLSLPTGSRFLTTDEAVPAVALLVDRAVSERWSVSANLGYTAGPDAQQDVWSVILTPGASIPGPLNLTAFVGYGGFFASGPDRHVVEAGLTFGPSSDLQLDANWGIDIDTGDYFVGIGFARRWGWRGSKAYDSGE